MERPCGNRRRQVHEQGPAACGVLGTERRRFGRGRRGFGESKFGTWEFKVDLWVGRLRACGRRCLPLRGKVRAVPGDEVWVCCSLAAACHPVAGTHFARKRRLGRPCVRCLAPLGQGALPVCVFDAVCPAGQKRFRVGAPDFGRFTGKSFLRGRFAHQETFPARQGNGVAGHISSLLLFAANIRGEAYGRDRFSPFTSFSRPQKAIFPPSPPPHPPPSRGENGGLCPHPLKGFIP